ncbi:flagellar biosynthetic protein FliO [Atopomonas sediminilitoris]|uniref:flagellar biosynthetic protein FliO n=1 Tax=Atopomonas sediminilitoris TaxID=2919919 RepID=UPI001F4DD188|nr:flagellar biosynthetic protein FliO [Atopomonas sediminilitoris]MCJ8167940.1 flagellar biosynthetic protein FliO [Atopomonas sediminilitoris]
MTKRLLMACCAALIGEQALAAAAVSAAPVAEAAATAEPLAWGSKLIELSVALLAVIALVFVMAWLMRRMQQFGPAGKGAIKLLAAVPLSPRERLVLVQVGNQQLLLGVSPGRISTLHELREPIPVTTTSNEQPEFAQRLLEMLNKDKRA